MSLSTNSRGWLYYVDFPGMEFWKNASSRGIYNILDAPHVLAQNRKPRWQCLDCGHIVEGTMEPDSCPGCSILSKGEPLIIEELVCRLGPVLQISLPPIEPVNGKIMWGGVAVYV
jgi:hypothetical protein